MDQEIKIQIAKLLMMLMLIVTMIVLAIVIFKYIIVMRTNPCDFCDCVSTVINLK